MCELFYHTLNNNGNLTLNPGVDNDIKFEHIPTSGSGNTLKIDGGIVYEETSSARHKTDIRPMEPSSVRVLDLEPRSFEYSELGHEDIGLIAEDVDKELPSLVTYDEEGRHNGVRYDRLGVYLIPEVDANRDRLDNLEKWTGDHRATIEELEADLAGKDAQIENQQDRIEALEGENARLHDRLAAIEDHLKLDSAASPDPADDQLQNTAL